MRELPYLTELVLKSTPRKGCVNLFWRRKPKNLLERVLQDMSGPAKRGHLEHMIQPATGQILEACAFHLRRIQIAAKADPSCTNVAEAGESAMRQAIEVCAPYLWRQGDPRGWSSWFGNVLVRKGPVKKILYEVFGDDFGGAFARAFDVMRGDPNWEAQDLQQMPEGVRPAYDIAMKLKHAAFEVERRARETVHTVPGQPIADIEAALSELREIRQAERELDDSTRLRHGN